jgi:rubredoxin
MENVNFVIESPHLRVPCNPNDHPSKGEHKHRCDSCGHCWKHNSGLVQSCQGDEFRLAHTCSHCGFEQRAKYRTEEEEAVLESKFEKLDDDMAGFLLFVMHITGKDADCVLEEAIEEGFV